MEGVSVYYVWEKDWLNREGEVKAALERLILHGEESELLNKLTGSLDTVLMEKVKPVGKKKVPAHVQKCNTLRDEIEVAAADPDVMLTDYCETIGVARTSFSRWLKENSIEWVGRGKRRIGGGKHVGLDELRRIAADSSISYVKAAAILGTSTSRVVNLCKWNNIEWVASARGYSSAMEKPACSPSPGRKPRSKKRVTESYGDIIEKYWDREKNTVDPANLSWDNEVLYWWRCSEGHSYEKTIEKRLRHGCPVCHGRLVQPGVNDFASAAGDKLLSEWSSENGRGPETYSRGSNAKVQWRCSRGHEFSMEINRRLRRGDRCPYCSGKALVPGENDLRTHCEREPSLAHLMGEWSAENPPMNSFPPRSGRVVKWVCSNCGHGWSTTVANRTAPGAATGCPSCARRR